jgi:pimeloyl-ACP methyl ester carboxylesterase
MSQLIQRLGSRDAPLVLLIRGGGAQSISWCDVSGGQATAEAIPGAELVVIEGMGHNLPPGLRPQLTARIAEFVWRAERAISEA